MIDKYNCIYLKIFSILLSLLIKQKDKEDAIWNNILGDPWGKKLYKNGGVGDSAEGQDSGIYKGHVQFIQRNEVHRQDI